MATITLTGDVNYDTIIGKAASATIDTLSTSSSVTLTVDTDSRYCNSNVGAATANTGSLDNIATGGSIFINGTKTKLIPYKSGSGTPPNLHTAIAVSAAVYASGIVTITTAAHGLTIGTIYRCRVSGITALTVFNGYNGLFDMIVATSTTMKYAVASDPGTATITNGRFTRYFQVSKSLGNSLSITAATTAGAGIPYVATITCNAHGLSVADWVVISGMTPAGYNGTFSIVAVTANTFDVWLGATATSGTVFGTVTKYVRASFQSAWTTFTGLPNPTGTNGAGTLGALGFIKIKDLQGGSFSSGSLVWEGGTAPVATAIDSEFVGWIEVAGAETAGISLTRLGGGLNITGDWFYPVLMPSISTSITNSTTTATLTTAAAHGIVIGSIIKVSGATPSAYNGTFEVLTVPTSTTLTYTMLSNPGGNASVQGDFYVQICTSGSNNQTIQLPAPLANTYYSGVWIETAKSSGVYDYYPATGLPAGTGTASVGTEAGRGKVVWMSTQGLIRIGHDGTNINGYTPVSGCKIRVPNILLVSTLKAATVGANTNAIPNTTLATRYDFAPGGASISIDKCVMAWHGNFTNSFNLTIANTSFSDVLAILESASPVTVSNSGVGCTDATRTQVALTLQLCLSGGNFTDTVFCRNTAATAVNNSLIQDCSNFVFTNTIFSTWPIRGAATGGRATINRSIDCVFNNTKIVGGGFNLTSNLNLIMNNSSYVDVAGGNTGTTVGTLPFSLSTSCNNVLLDGLNFAGITNVHPYTGIIDIQSGCQNIKLRNIGTPGVPISLGSVNACGSLLSSVASAALANIELKRIYFSDQRAATAMLTTASIDNSINKLTLDNVWTGAAVGAGYVSLNTRMRGIGNSAYLTTGNSSQYGTHFLDCFLTSTTGKIVVQGNEKTSIEPSASAYTIETQGDNSGFDAAGAFYMVNLNDQITWNLPLIIGHLSFDTTAILINVASGTTSQTQLDFTYDLAQGSSGAFSGVFKNLLYRRAGGGGSSGSANITMTSTTGVLVNDYIYGTNIGVAARVQSITNATTIVSTVVNSGVVSGILTFNTLPNETITSAEAGFRLKIRVKTITANTTNRVTNIAIGTTCNATSMAYQYPLDSINLTLTGLITGSDIVILVAGTATNRVNVDGHASASYVFNYSTLGNVDIGVFKSGYVPLYVRNYPLGSSNASLPIAQVVDRNYA